MANMKLFAFAVIRTIFNNSFAKFKAEEIEKFESWFQKEQDENPEYWKYFGNAQSLYVDSKYNEHIEYAHYRATEQFYDRTDNCRPLGLLKLFTPEEQEILFWWDRPDEFIRKEIFG